MGIDRIYHVDVSVLLKPVISDRRPTCRIGLNDNLIDVILDQEKWFNFTYSGPIDSKIKLIVEHYGKTDADTNIQLDTDVAVILEQIKFNDITSPKFIWLGKYRPNYSSSYIKTCQTNGITLSPELTSMSYLGWNGIWTLEFTLPIYTWIHRVENLGWIYD
jgi:hypothetical protein